MLGIVGGSGLYSLGDDFRLYEQLSRETPYGETSADPLLGHWQDTELVFLPRHGAGHSVPPHRVNYRANLWALHDAGVRRVIAVNAVGAIDEGLVPGSLVVPRQLVDYSSGREHSYFDGSDGRVHHVDFSEPYSASLRQGLLRAGAQLGLDIFDGGTYGCTNGPRFESAAEIERMRRDGCTLVGMTGMPEAGLARELEIDYACLALVVNPAAGIGEAPISMEEIMLILERGIDRIRPLLLLAAARLIEE